MKNYIIIVSHGHENLICSNEKLQEVLFFATVIVKDNVGSPKLEEHCNRVGYVYLRVPLGLGFGANNNVSFVESGARDEDNILLVNPDVVIDVAAVKAVVAKVVSNPGRVWGIDLYRDEKYLVPDFSARAFPSFWTFVSSFLFGVNHSVLEKGGCDGDVNVDWIAGSFMAFKARVYRELRGFDESYFMYCEDLDFCYRAAKSGFQTMVTMDVKAVHNAEHANRKLFSKHFVWHVSSVFRFLMKRYFLFVHKSAL